MNKGVTLRRATNAVVIAGTLSDAAPPARPESYTPSWIPAPDRKETPA